jgi:LytR cell envelope-related transcriptional attenuator
VTAPRGSGGPARPSGISAAARGAILVGLAVLLGIVGLQILDDSSPGSGSGDVTATTVTDSTGTTTGSGPAGTTSARRPNREVKVKVYNASGVQGRAQILTDQLKALGYNMQAPATLSSERAGTVVECNNGLEAEGTLLALYGIGNGATAEPYPSNPPEGASEADCIVIIGTA